ncbi:MAG TPA: hypothetical protein VIP52_13610 [Candidatus Dormibacteraeota bacterium]
MSQRTLLVAALALIAAGLLVVVLGVVFGGGAGPVRSENMRGPWQQGPGGIIRPREPGFRPGLRPGLAPGQVVPVPSPTPSP